MLQTELRTSPTLSTRFHQYHLKFPIHFACGKMILIIQDQLKNYPTKLKSYSQYSVIGSYNLAHCEIVTLWEITKGLSLEIVLFVCETLRYLFDDVP